MSVRSPLHPASPKALLLPGKRSPTCLPPCRAASLNPVALTCCGPKPTAPSAPPPSEAPASCCGPTKADPAAVPSAGEQPNGTGHVTHADVSEYYGKRVKNQGDLQTSACLLQGGLTAEERRLLGNVHEEILTKFYGCGSPVPPLLQGLTVLDLGCGTGRDVYLVAQLVGEGGSAIGVDMTDEQLEVAQRHEDWHREKFGFARSNVSFRKGFIEDLASAELADNSVDVVISNCVINLAPDKAPVLAEIARVLKPGGELFFSDVYADRRVPKHLQQDKVLFGECLSGALYTGDFRRLMAQAGLPLWGITSARELAIENKEIQRQLGDIRFFEATIRAVKLTETDAAVDTDALEDFGQVAKYNGGIQGHSEKFVLDHARVFPSEKEVSVDSATAAALKASRYGAYFTVTEEGPHRGVFNKWPQMPASIAGFCDFSRACKSAPVKACCG